VIRPRATFRGKSRETEGDLDTLTGSGEQNVSRERTKRPRNKIGASKGRRRSRRNHTRKKSDTGSELEQHFSNVKESRRNGLQEEESACERKKVVN
jgi:hypothetical protein